MPWYLHVFWGAVCYLSAVQIGQGVARAGEWLAKALMKHSEMLATLQRELLARGGKRGDRP